jgi:hypothetical protein
VKVVTHFHLMQRVIPPLRHTSSWRGAWLSMGNVFKAWHLFKGRDNFTLPYFTQNFGAECSRKTENDAVNVNLTLFFTEHHTMKTWGNGGIASRIFNLGTRMELSGQLLAPPALPSGKGLPNQVHTRLRRPHGLDAVGKRKKSLPLPRSDRR